ncbi:lysophospholipid acyltransferase family protein [Paludifilum halophilum]|uniref:lysophospholipid acyltransferase family protein n=1 Tax=Paludifilum halophilum TaxID=1642702 RepID=UPI00146DA364|nr:lysophospholipid acyltransferase family protein [Paludifilum halophilum]
MEKATDVLLDRYARIHLIHGEKLDAIEEPVIFVSNHLSNIDGLILHRILKKKSVFFLAGIKLRGNRFNRLGLEIVPHIPIRPGKPDRAAIKQSVDTLQKGHSLFIFPEGTRSRTGSLIEAKRGILLIQRKTGAKIVPLGLTGTEKLMPIDDDNMAGEWFQRADVTLTVGDPIQLQSGDDVDRIMNGIARLLPPEYQGVYASEPSPERQVAAR